MADMKFSIAELKELMDKLASAHLGEFYLKDGDFELKIQAKKAEGTALVPAPAALSGGGSAKEVEDSKEEKPLDGSVVKSPIVGTFYASSAPGKPPFVEVGDRVKKGDVLFVIESMKLMNEVKSPYDGEVAEILVENGQGVEYSQPIMMVR